MRITFCVCISPESLPSNWKFSSTIHWFFFTQSWVDNFRPTEWGWLHNVLSADFIINMLLILLNYFLWTGTMTVTLFRLFLGKFLLRTTEQWCTSEDILITWVVCLNLYIFLALSFFCSLADPSYCYVAQSRCLLCIQPVGWQYPAQEWLLNNT